VGGGKELNTQCQTLSEQTWEKQQRLRMRMGQHAYIGDKLNKHQREVGRHPKTESKDGVTSQLPKMEQVVDPGPCLLEQRAVLKIELSHLA
jgi:hypothetical protein